MKNEIIFFETEDKSITLPVQVSTDTFWLNRSQLSELFGRDIKTIGKHIGNALKEELEESEVVAKFATTTRHGAIEGKTRRRVPPLGEQCIEAVYHAGICGQWN